METVGFNEGEGEDNSEDKGVDKGEVEDDGEEKGRRGGLGQEKWLFSSCLWSFPGPSTSGMGACTSAAEGGVVVAELRQLRGTISPGLDSVKLVLDIMLDTLSPNTADLQRRSMPWPGPKLGVRAPGNIRQRLNADERHTAKADIQRQSGEEGIPKKAGRVVELTWWRQRPHLVEQQGGSHVTVDVGQRHE